MSSARLFRSMSTTPDPAKVRLKVRMRKTHARLSQLRDKIRDRLPLTDGDHRILAKCGPHTLEWLGYDPAVTLK
jgi:hypothetical protein